MRQNITCCFNTGLRTELLCANLLQTRLQEEQNTILTQLDQGEDTNRTVQVGASLRDHFLARFTVTGARICYSLRMISTHWSGLRVVLWGSGEAQETRRGRPCWEQIRHSLHRWRISPRAMADFSQSSDGFLTEQWRISHRAMTDFSQSHDGFLTDP